MGVETRAGVYIPTTSECDSALGRNQPDTSKWLCYIEEEGLHLCNGCGCNIPSSQWENHIHTCEPMGVWIKNHVRIVPEEGSQI